MRMHTMLAMLAAVGLAAQAGCLKRKERIIVDPSGAVTMKVKFKGTQEEIAQTRDALPGVLGGWRINREIEERQDDKPKHILRARKDFAPDAALPATYADANDPDADLALRFPTEVTIEQRADGRYYHFRRMYIPRPWAHVEYWHDLLIDKDFEKLGEKPEDELTEDERVRILRAFATVAAMEQIEFARLAARQSVTDLRQDDWLAARAALQAHYEAIDYVEMVRKYQAMPKQQREAVFEVEADQIIDAGYEALRGAMRDAAGLNTIQLAAFEREYNREKTRSEITEELGSHQFRIWASLPGEIVAHNGDGLESDDGLVYVKWEFSGDAFRDRPFELMATSRIVPGESTQP